MTSPSSDTDILSNNDLEILKDYEKVNIQYLRKKYEVILPPFRLVGRGGRNKGGTSMNLVQEIATLSKASTWLLAELEANLSYMSNEAVIKVKDLTEADVKKLRRGYKELRERDLVRRVKQNTYMINPRLIIPPKYDSALLDYYNSLK